MNECENLSLAALLHDIGKFGQRAGIDIKKDNYDFQNYCPMKFGSYWTHQHSAYTADFLKSVVGKQGEFSFINTIVGNESFENISAKHHKPTTAKEWIVAIADRVASGFEREEFNKYNNSDDRGKKSRYYEVPLENIFDDKKIFDLKQFDTKSIFASEVKKLSKDEYKELYTMFEADVEKLKSKPKSNFIDGIDFLLKKYTSFIPSSTYGTKANIPLYDHLKTTASFASALASFHKDDKNINNIKDYDTKKYLLIAGDFFGIQEFIFSNLPTSKASKILRGKSAFIQIFVKIVALDICKRLNISKLSIISDTAGKFEILASNTAETKQILKKVQESLNGWFLQNTFGQSGIGISFVEASGSDFTSGNFQNLRDKLAKQIEATKYTKFDLTTLDPIFDIETKDNEHLCKTCNQRFLENSKDENCSYCDIFVKLGEQLAKAHYINITSKKTNLLIYGEYFVEFKDFIDENSQIVFDISNDEEFRGYSKWALKSYVKFSESEDRIEEFEELAMESCGGEKQGVKALMALKGDVDNMGNFFKQSNKINSFAKYNFISRLIDYFFSVKVSQMMSGKNLYTIFAGGDDIFIIGAWDEVIEISKKIREEFMQFISGSNLSISMGLVMFKPSKPINFIAKISEEALESAKELDGKDSITLFEESVKWEDYLDEKNAKYLLEEINRIDKSVFLLNTAFTYRLLEFIQMSKKANIDPINNMWKSKLSYSFSRNILDKVFDDDKKEDLLYFLSLLDNIIQNKPEAAKMIISEFIYKRRD